MPATRRRHTLSLPYLPDSVPCPIAKENLLRYLRGKIEGKPLSEADVAFQRSARIGECDYWLWRLEEDEMETFALVMRDPTGDAWPSHRRNDAHLSPEQVLLADYRAALSEE
jgi:hypothetical protein